MSTEKVLADLENEVKALKTAYEQTALQLPVFTYSIDFRTTLNKMKVTYPGGTPVEFDGIGRVEITFTSSRGANALAFLEVKNNDAGTETVAIKYRRVPYSGGAKWILFGINTETVYTIQVQTAMQGTLGAKMIWQ